MLQSDSRDVADPLFAARPPVTIANLSHGAPQAYAGARIEVFSPYNGRLLGSVPDSGPAQVDDIVRGAVQAARTWGLTPIKQRTLPLFRFRELLLSELEPLALSASRECGKTLDEAKAGILKGVEVIEFALSLQNLDAGGTMEVSQGVRCEVRREPLGVVAGVTPFNFPAMVPLWLFPIAITLGNAFILKPSEKVPLTGARLGELMLEAGYPAGVFSVLHGGRSAVEALIDHPDVQAYGFVGSSKVAAEVYARGSARGKRVLALGGAKNTMILAPDAAPELAVPGVVASFTGCAGQRCMAGSLLVAVGDSDALVDRIVEQARAMRVPHDMGAIIDANALSKLESAIERGVQEGAQLRLDGRRPAAPAGGERGHWLAPTVLDNVDPSSFCAQEELFGPVLSIVRVPNLHSALEIEANSRYGNATSVFTQSGQVARIVSDQASSGMIGINIGVPVPREPFSFGGTKGSRFGHGDITGQGGVEFWTKLKKVTAKWAQSTISAENGSWMS
jgi:malonate-semialdehyde dehydrogenase (acetylating) / methylmalonate-semialdehyde dehydrogenase